MIIIKKMFWIYTLPFLFLIGYIFVAFIFKVIKEVIKKEVSLEDFTKEVDVRYARLLVNCLLSTQRVSTN